MGENTSFPARFPNDNRRERPGGVPLLVFVHLRKTAGTTISYVMQRQFGRDQAIEINAPTVEAANQTWGAMTPERRARIKCVRGHLPYRKDLFAPREITCFTVLRDPVARVVSEYYFNLRNAGERFHAALSRKGVTLDQFVDSELFAEVHNTQSRMLAGADPGADPSQLLDAAIANLRDKMALVGVSERLDETLLLSRAILGWRWLIYRRINVNPRRPPIDRIAPATLAAIERANSLDRSLYRFACEQLNEQIRKYRITDSDILALRRVSRLYGATRRLIGLPREFWIEAQLASARRRAAINR